MDTFTIYKKILNRLPLRIGNHNANRLFIFTYHGVIRSPLNLYDWCFLDVSVFKKHVDYIINYFDVLAFSDAIDRLRDSKISKPTAVITFDDGFQNNYDFAFPILREAGLPATIFLTTGLVDTNDTVWFCRLIDALSFTNRTSLEWGEFQFNLSGTESKLKAKAEIYLLLKKLPHHQLLSEVNYIVHRLGRDPDRPIEVDSPYRMLSGRAIEEMVTSGLIDFGGHTHKHAILSLITSEERESEINKSVRSITQLTGGPCKFFAYPNGRLVDYNDEAIKILKNMGIKAAVTAIEGVNDDLSSMMELHRYGIGANLTPARFKRKIFRLISQTVLNRNLGL